nr:cyclic nucleotide-binding domain-containing protein [Anaerolineae bacterium]
MAKKVDKTTEYVNILRRADIFYDLTEPQLEMIAVLCSEVTPKAGEIIFEENSAGDELYVIANGEVDILVDPALIQPATTGEPSRPRTVVTLRRGQSFGEVALVDQGLRSASARCVSRKARLLVIPRDRLIRLCDSYPDLGYRLMRNIAADLAFKIRDTDLMIREQLLWRPRPR